jgi:hypothetical protein
MTNVLAAYQIFAYFNVLGFLTCFKDDDLIKHYFHQGFRIKDISAALYHRHGIRKS